MTKLTWLILGLALAPRLGDRRIERLDGGDPEAAAELLATQGEERAQVTRALLSGIDACSATARLARARLLVELAGPGDLTRLAPLAEDRDPGVRAAWLEAVARPGMGAGGSAEVTLALERRARLDGDAKLRARAIAILGELDTEGGVAALGRLIDDLPAADAVLAVQALEPTPRARAAVMGRVARAMASGEGGALPAEVLAALLPLYGRYLAEAAPPGSARPLAQALRHSDPRVREAAIAAQVAFEGRLRQLGAAAIPGALDLLDELGRCGVDPRLCHHRSSLLALFPGVDGARALEEARAVRRAAGPGRAVAEALLREKGDRIEAGRWLFRSWYVEGLAELALGHPERARAALDEAGRGLELALDEAWGSERSLGERELLARADLFDRRALVAIASALAELAGGAKPGEGRVLAQVQRAHRLSLEAQVARARAGQGGTEGWDLLLDAPLSPYRLLFAGVAHPGLTIADGIELQRGLGRALAAISPAEVPGFEPPEGIGESLGDPLADPARRTLLEEVQRARLEALGERIDALTTRLAERAGNGWERPEAELEELALLDRRRQLLLMERGGAESLRGLRMPASLALWLAEDLREEGRGSEARALARAMQEQLEGEGISRWWYYPAQVLIARADLAIGSAYTDEDEPLRAQEALLAAVERLEGLERQLTENGAGPDALALYRSLRATALVSLAVNANVKLGDPDQALDYYEKAYALRSDEFMTVLLACYRARSGRSEEARDLLRRVRPGPGTWYNLACTHALLGDREEALDWLAKELAENHPSEASRERQRIWARGDPDLASLRGDPRFQALVGGR